MQITLVPGNNVNVGKELWQNCAKEVQIVCRLFLVNCYLLHRNIQSETEADRGRSI